MPVQTKSSSKNKNKKKEETVTLQTNPFLEEQPFFDEPFEQQNSDKPSSSDKPLLDQSLSSNMYEGRQEKEAGKCKAHDDLCIQANDSDSSFSDSNVSEPGDNKIVKYQKDKDFRKMMKIIMAQEKEEYFLELAKQGAKIPPDYNVESLITKEDDTPLALVTKQLHELHTEIKEMKDKDKSPIKYSLNIVCSFLFDKSLYMPLFPSRIEIPKFDIYDGNSDPQDHVQELCALCMEFMHKQTYLMCLFPRSLGRQDMEWFSSLLVGIKYFEELVELFLQ